MPSSSRSGTARSACVDRRPPRSPRARPAAATSRARCRAGTRSRRPWRRRTATAGCRRRARAAPIPAGASSPSATKTIAPTYAAPNTAHASVCHSALHPPRPRHRSRTTRSHAARRCVDERGADAGDPHLLARRRRRAEHEQVPGQAVVRGAASPRPRARRRAATTALITVGQREHDEQHERRMDRRQQHDGDGEPQDPAERREERHEQVVEREHLVAQHREAVEVLGSLLVLDRRDRRLQPRDVRLERDADPVAEAALHAVEQHLQVPRRGRRDAPGRRPRRRSWCGGRSSRRRRAAPATARAARRAAR